MITPEVIKFQNELATPLFAYVYSADMENHVQRAYIAGKVTGLDMEEVRNKFACAEMEVRFCGYDVVNPVTGTNHLPDGTKWETYMRITMCLMMTCDVVIALPDADRSKGARAEMETATALGIPVISYNDLLNEKKRRNTHATA